MYDGDLRARRDHDAWARGGPGTAGAGGRLLESPAALGSIGRWRNGTTTSPRRGPTPHARRTAESEHERRLRAGVMLVSPAAGGGDDNDDGNALSIGSGAADPSALYAAAAAVATTPTSTARHRYSSARVKAPQDGGVELAPQAMLSPPSDGYGGAGVESILRNTTAGYSSRSGAGGAGGASYPYPTAFDDFSPAHPSIPHIWREAGRALEAPPPEAYLARSSPIRGHTASPSPPGSPYTTPRPPPGPPSVSEVYIVEWSPHSEPQMLEIQRGSGGGAGGIACAVLHLAGVRTAVVRADNLREVTAGTGMWFTLLCKTGESFKIRPRSHQDFNMLAEALAALQNAAAAQELDAYTPPESGAIAKKIAPSPGAGSSIPLAAAAFLKRALAALFIVAIVLAVVTYFVPPDQRPAAVQQCLRSMKAVVIAAVKRFGGGAGAGAAGGAHA